MNDILIFNEDAQDYNGSSYSSSVTHIIEKFTSNGIKIWDYEIDLFEHVGNPKIQMKSLNDSSYLIAYNRDWGNDGINVGDYDYYGRQNCEFIFNNEVSTQQKEYQDLFRHLMSVENNKFHRLIYHDRNVCINNEIYPSGKLYLLINTD